MGIHVKTLSYSIVALLSLAATLLGCTTTKTTHQTNTPGQAAIASAHPLATQAGLDVLNQGGNAFDAGIAIAAVLGVVEPYSAGIGGGGFWLIQPAGQKAVMIDARETAPQKLTASAYYTNNEFDRDKAINGALAAGIPGQPAAFAYLAEHYGNLTLTETLESAIHHAKNGFQTNPVYQRLLEWRAPVMERYPSSHHFILQQQSNEHPTLYQPDLANTLEQLAQKGHSGFYQGQVANRLVESVNAAGGLWSLKDLEQYQVILRQPITGTYHDLTITSAAPPSAGGILLVNMLNMLEPYNLQEYSTVERAHLIAEVMRRAYKQRSKHIGDPDFFNVPTTKLTSKAFAKQQMSDFDWEKASVSAQLNIEQEGTHTTHFSVLDQEGNRLSATLSINLPFGSGFVAEGTGVLLNNELDDFSLERDGENAYGLTGGKANSLEPGKRPLSSMTPTFIENDQWLGILGTPGGSRITTMVLLGVLEASQLTEPDQWVSLKRFHHQYLPDRIEVEPDTFTQTELEALKDKGHSIKMLNRQYGDMQAILWRKGGDNTEVLAASDPRRIGEAKVTSLKPQDQ